MLNFCTLFDSHYLIKGLCLYDSLKRATSDFHLYIFAFDEKAQSILLGLNLENVTVISLREFEDEKLLQVKGGRTKGEYCWTATSSTILYCLEHFQLPDCTYIDADLYFFSDPKVLIEEMGNNDVLITEHRYTPKYDQSKESGKYCVQFMTFKNTSNGLFILNWWRESCLDWCYARIEDGKFGDQKYLDDWTTRFSRVYELQHLGGGVAPWNMQQYEFAGKDGKLTGKELSTGNRFDLIFFHFHFMHTYKIGPVMINYLGVYDIPPTVKKEIYNPYIKAFKRQIHTLKKADIFSKGMINRHKNISGIIRSFARYMLKNDKNYLFTLNNQNG